LVLTVTYDMLGSTEYNWWHSYKNNHNYFVLDTCMCTITLGGTSIVWSWSKFCGGLPKQNILFEKVVSY